jgi:hypothetical protein
MNHRTAVYGTRSQNGMEVGNREVSSSADDLPQNR